MFHGQVLTLRAARPFANSRILCEILAICYPKSPDFVRNPVKLTPRLCSPYILVSRFDRQLELNG